VALGLLAAGMARGEDWPQWLGPKRDSVWRETGIVDKFPPGGPVVKWKVPVAGGYAGPAVADGRVYVADYQSSGDKTPNPNARTNLDGTERIQCFSAADGKLLWKHDYPCHYHISYAYGPRATPTVSGGKVYVLGAMGNLLCLDAVKGTVLWQRDLKKDFETTAPIWGFTGHPLVDGQKLICLVGGKGSVAVALDKDTGKEIWRSLSAPEPGYSPPTLIEAGGTRQLLIWHPQAINSLDPETGKVYWSVSLEPSYGMSIMAPRQLGDRLFAGGIGDQSALLKLAGAKPAAEVVWRGSNKTSVGPVNMTPFLEDGHLYGVDRGGELRCVKLDTGERLWQTYAATTGKRMASSGTAFLIKNGDRFFLASENGDLIIAKLSPKGYEEISRCKLLEPTSDAFGRSVVWSHPAFANHCVYARNDKELVCVSLATER